MNSPRLYLLACLVFFLAKSLSGQTSERSDSLMALEKKIYSLRTTQANLVPVLYIQLDDIAASLKHFQQQHEASPLAFAEDEKEKLILMQQHFDSLAMVITRKMNRIELVLYEEAMENLRRSDTLKSVELLQLALQHKPAYAPAAYELISLHLTPGKSREAMHYFTKHQALITGTDNPYYQQLFVQTADRIVDSLLQFAQILENEHLPLDALEIIQVAEAFSTQYLGTRNKEKISAAFSRGHQHMYASFLRIADRALEAGKAELASSYYQKAGDYALANSQFMNNDRRWEAGLSLALKPKPTQVLKEESPEEQLKQSDTPLPAILDKYQGSQTPLSQSEKADSSNIPLLTEQQRQVLLDTLHKAYYTTWKNELEKARSVLNYVRETANYFQCAQDTALVASINELERRLEDKTCTNFLSLYESEIYRAISRFKLGQYLEGWDHLELAGKAKAASPACIPSDSLFNAVKSHHAPIVQWYQHWIQARQGLSMQDYSRFREEYRMAYATFSVENLSAKGIVFSPLGDFILQQSRPELIAYCLEQSLAETDLMFAWELLQKMQKPLPLPKSLLIETAKMMAITDRQNSNKAWLEALGQANFDARLMKKTYFRYEKKMKHDP